MGLHDCVRSLRPFSLEEALREPDLALDDLRALFRCEQDPIWHAEGNVGVHTQRVLEALWEEWGELDEASRLVLNYAALAHDLGKPATTERQPDGRITARGHEAAGCGPARRLLEHWGVEREARQEIIALVEHHLVPMHSGNVDAARIGTLVQPPWLWRLARADARGRVSETVPELLARIGAFSDLCRAQACWGAAPDPWLEDADFAALQIPESEREAWRRRLRWARYRSWVKSRDAARPWVERERGRRGGHLVLTAGIAGSGKTRALSERFPGVPVVAVAELPARLRAGEAVAVDAPHLDRARHAVVDAGRIAGARVTLIFCDAPLEECLSRLRTRGGSFDPEELRRLHGRLRGPRPAEADEVVWVP